jgi:hypothetical protein
METPPCEFLLVDDDLPIRIRVQSAFWTKGESPANEITARVQGRRFHVSVAHNPFATGCSRLEPVEVPAHSLTRG